jgi:uncharacterized membrane protein YeaQ/YmgE (transglycosylase-associated protein family)
MYRRRGSWLDWLRAGKILRGNDYGPIMDTVMGIGGAVVGGFLMRCADLGRYGRTIITTLVAMIGAVVPTRLGGFVNGTKMYAWQL